MRLANAISTAKVVGNRIEVELEGDIIYCSANLVNGISIETGEGIEDIALIVARIKVLGEMYGNRESFIRKQRFRAQDIKKILPDIIGNYGIEDTLELMEGLKYHELQEILDSPEPLEVIQKFI